MIGSVFITGANAGLGREVARQIAGRDDVRRVHLACRDAAKAEVARAELASVTGRDIFEVIVLDTTDIGSVHGAVAQLSEPIDALLMNAGGVGGATPLALTADGATCMFAANVLGHVALLDALVAERKLGTAAVYVGSEAARGVPKLMIKRPTFSASSTDEFVSVIDGSYYRDRKLDVMYAYAQVKYLAALWMGAVARRNPQLRCATVSPGNTTGTEASEEMPFRERLLMRHVVPLVGPLLGIAHPIDVGAPRLVAGLTDERFRGGAFYASPSSGVTGPLVDQVSTRPELADPVVQDNALHAIHRFLR